MLVADLKKAIKEVPDYPKPGITFYDLSTLFRDGLAFKGAIDRMVERYRGEKIDALAAIEARGFLLGSALAYELGVGLVLLRKEGKLPRETDSVSYALEYGESKIEMHTDAVSKGQRIVVVDDLLATGGTAAAAGRLIERFGGQVTGYGFMVELGFLNGREQLGSSGVFSLIQYDG